MQNNILGIQYLRAMAAVLVVAAHGSSLLPGLEWIHGGVAGVDIFFVVSGFIMAHTTRRFDGTKPALQAWQFMWRRILRIVPLYWIALIWTLKVPLAHGHFSVDYAKDFIFVPRIHSTGNTWPELIAGWTLNYEMFFYVMFALAMLAGRMRYWTLGLILAGLVAFGLTLHPTGTVAAFYTDPIVLEFVFGVAVYYLAPAINASRPFTWGLLCIGFAVLLTCNGTVHRVVAAGIPAVLIVWAAVNLSVGMTEMRWLRFVGDASYSIYLFHLAVLALIVKAMGAGPPVEALPLPIAFLLIVAMPIGVGMAVHLLIERPLLRRLVPKNAIIHTPTRMAGPELTRARPAG